MTITLGSNSTFLQHSISRVNAELNKSLERLASGTKLNHASDGAGNILVSENLTSHINGYQVASSNIQQGLSMLSTADSALQQIYDHLQNIRDIAVQGANGTTSTAQYSALTADLKAELSAIGGITANTKYGANVLLDGSMSGTAFNLQIGAEAGDSLDIQTAFTDSTYATLGMATTSITDTATSSTLMANVDTALSKLSQNLATVGQFENRLNDHLDYLSNIQSNTESARSSIRDTDVAAETANVSRLNILQQAGAYALAQSNTSAQLALTLLQRM